MKIKKKSLVILQGGLGNQMFQYAFYLAMKEHSPNTDYDCSIVNYNNDHNGFELENIFNIKAKQSKLTLLIVKILKRYTFLQKHKFISLLNIKLITDSVPSIYNSIFLKKNKTFRTYYLGYWQTEKYFEEIEDKVRNTFTFDKTKLSDKSNSIVSEIQSNTSVSIHIRRGDYLFDKNINLYGNICTNEYYNKAIKLIQDKYPQCHFYVFSDDCEWAKENLHINGESTYINFNKGKNSWQDMYLMSLCKHNIIANSSFSWWGAWLNSNPSKTVICPSKFINSNSKSDIIPENWLTIEV